MPIYCGKFLHYVQQQFVVSKKMLTIYLVFQEERLFGQAHIFSLVLSVYLLAYQSQRHASLDLSIFCLIQIKETKLPQFPNGGL
jgi:hypothetical protein